MWTCNRLDLQRAGSQPVMPKNLPNHCSSMKERSLKCVVNVSTMSESGFRDFGGLARTPNDNVTSRSMGRLPCAQSKFPVGFILIFTLFPWQSSLRAEFHVPVRSVLLDGWETGDTIQKMGDVTHFMEGYFYVGCRFIGIPYFLTKFGEW